MRERTAILVLFLAAACARVEQRRPPEATPAQPTAVPPTPVGYAIRGEERPSWTPGWRAVIVGRRILLDSPTSAGWYAVEATDTGEGVRRTYTGEDLTLTVEVGGCAIPSYRRELPDGITLEWDRGRFTGCGGPRREPSALAGSTWELVRLGNEVAPRSRTPPAVVTFAPDGSVHGSEACNDTGGTVRWTDRGFAPTREEGRERTAMGCGDERAVAFGDRFWSLLREARTWRRVGESLLIQLRDGSEAELRIVL